MTQQPRPARPAAALTEGIADMDRSSLSLILIPIVVVISLAAWLILVAYAATHPSWKHGPASPQGARTAPFPGAQVPLPRTEVQRPVPQPTGTKPLAAAGHAGR
jgi:hypothetical protein